MAVMKRVETTATNSSLMPLRRFRKIKVEMDEAKRLTRLLLIKIVVRYLLKRWI